MQNWMSPVVCCSLPVQFDCWSCWEKVEMKVEIAFNRSSMEQQQQLLTFSILILVSLSMRIASSRYSRRSCMAWMSASHWACTRRSNSMQDSCAQVIKINNLLLENVHVLNLRLLCRSCLWAAVWVRLWNVPSPTIVADCVRVPSAEKGIQKDDISDEPKPKPNKKYIIKGKEMQWSIVRVVKCYDFFMKCHAADFSHACGSAPFFFFLQQILCTYVCMYIYKIYF